MRMMMMAMRSIGAVNHLLWLICKVVVSTLTVALIPHHRTIRYTERERDSEKSYYPVDTVEEVDIREIIGFHMQGRACEFSSVLLLEPVADLPLPAMEQARRELFLQDRCCFASPLHIIIGEISGTRITC